MDIEELEELKDSIENTDIIDLKLQYVQAEYIKKILDSIWENQDNIRRRLRALEDKVDMLFDE